MGQRFGVAATALAIAAVTQKLVMEEAAEEGPCRK